MQLTSSKILVTVQFLTCAYIVLSGRIWITSPALLCLAMLSLIMAVWAIASIKLKHLKISPEVNPTNNLITHGPYKYIRHPMYASLLLIMLCLVANDFNWLRFTTWIVLFVNLLIKISVEEKLLASHFPAYTEYQHKTHKLLPFIL